MRHDGRVDCNELIADVRGIVVLCTTYKSLVGSWGWKCAREEQSLMLLETVRSPSEHFHLRGLSLRSAGERIATVVTQ